MRTKLLFLSAITLLLISCTPTYIVTFSANTGGIVSDVGGEFDEGTVITVTAQPDTGYEFQGWSDGSNQNPRSITVTESLNLTAFFSKLQFAVLTSVQGEGTIQSSGSNGQGEFEYGVNARFEAIPSTGWLFDYWEGDVSGTNNPLSVSIDAPISVRAIFKREKFDLNITVVGEGSVTEEVVVQPGQYDFESQVKLTAEPEEGWEFDNWTGDIGSSDNPITITVNTAKNITATFKKLNPLFLDDNGITVKAKDYGYVGDSWILNGIEYLIVDDTSLRDLITQGQDITKVVTTKVTNMSSLFFGNATFNANIESWDTTNVESMNSMFAEATSFNQDISHWSTGNVKTMNNMFREATSFNKNISEWDTSSVTEMNDMFYQAKSFNRSLNGWDVSSVTNMSRMFFQAEAFNGEINEWDTSSLVDVTSMFNGAILFNQAIDEWDTSKIIDMEQMFHGAIAFNQPLNSWDTSNVKDMQVMFKQASSFNQPLDNWDTSQVLNMRLMFNDAVAFNQDISSWCVPGVSEAPEEFYANSKLTIDKIPVWGTCPLVDDDDLDGVVNHYDKCPGTNEGDEVNEEGCSVNQIDDNNNGIPDSLEGDADNDGVIDYYDECSNTTPGAAVDSKGCAVVDQVFLFSGAVSTVVLNNNVSGTISFSIRNNLDEPIQLESLKVYDGETGVLRATADRNSNPNLFPALSPGQSHSLQSTFNSFIYLPMYYWRFTYKGQVYEVSKRWSLTSGQSRPPRDANETKAKEWDEKVVSFRLVNN